MPLGAKTLPGQADARMCTRTFWRLVIAALLCLDNSWLRLCRVAELMYWDATRMMPEVDDYRRIMAKHGTLLTIVFPTALLEFLLWALPCLSRTCLTIVFILFSLLRKGDGG